MSALRKPNEWGSPIVRMYIAWQEPLRGTAQERPRIQFVMHNFPLYFSLLLWQPQPPTAAITPFYHLQHP
jgi:hypothetical protein